MDNNEWKTGVVKFFNNKSKFGFIKVDDSDQEIYVHQKDCMSNIAADDRVKFKIGDAKRGPIAMDVTLDGN